MNCTFHKTEVQAEEKLPVNISTFLATHTAGSKYMISDIKC
jgi:hypothetical protein